MRVEVTELLPVDQLEPGDLYTNRDQEWWDLTLGANQIAVMLYMRSEFPLPQAYEGSSFHRVIIHKDEEGVSASKEIHIADEDPDEADVPTTLPDFHCQSCGGMGTNDDGSPCSACDGKGVAPNG